MKTRRTQWGPAAWILICAFALSGCGDNSSGGSGSPSAASNPFIAVAQSQTVLVDPEGTRDVTLRASRSGNLQWRIVSTPTRGTLLGTAPNLTYVPNSGFVGDDSFVFEVNDGIAPTQATVSLQVYLGVGVNGPAGTITLFNLDSLAPVVGNFTVSGTYPWFVTISPDRQRAYILHRDSNNVSAFDLSQRSETGFALLSGSQPVRAMIANDGFLYVSYLQSNFLSRVDITAGVPTEVATIPLSGATSWNGIALAPNGQSLYVGAAGGERLAQVDLSTLQEDASWDTAMLGVDVRDVAIDEQGRLYGYNPGDTEILRWDPANPTNATPLPLGISATAAAMIVDEGRAYVALRPTTNATVDGGALSVVELEATSTGYAFDRQDDSFYEVPLPFDFSFDGLNYSTVYISSNGYVSLGSGVLTVNTDIALLNGFAATTEDPTSADFYNFSSQVDANRAVFQWCTSGYVFPPTTNPADYASVFEIVLWPDGRARFDYLFSADQAVATDAGTRYGVGNGSQALVDLRAQYGSPYELEQRSFSWNPANPTEITEVPFEWAGTGVVHLPVAAAPASVAVTETRIFVGCPETGAASADGSDEIHVFDRATLLPLDTIELGSVPTAIAVPSRP